MEHIPTNPQFDNVEIVKETTSLKNNQLNENDTDNIDNDINEINHLNFNINLKGFEATDNKINIVSVFDTINNIRKNSSFKICRKPSPPSRDTLNCSSSVLLLIPH